MCITYVSASQLAKIASWSLLLLYFAPQKSWEQKSRPSLLVNPNSLQPFLPCKFVKNLHWSCIPALAPYIFRNIYKMIPLFMHTMRNSWNSNRYLISWKCGCNVSRIKFHLNPIPTMERNGVEINFSVHKIQTLQANQNFKSFQMSPYMSFVLNGIFALYSTTYRVHWLKLDYIFFTAIVGGVSEMQCNI